MLDITGTIRRMHAEGQRKYKYIQISKHKKPNAVEIQNKPENKNSFPFRLL